MLLVLVAAKRAVFCRQCFSDLAGLALIVYLHCLHQCILQSIGPQHINRYLLRILVDAFGPKKASKLETPPSRGVISALLWYLMVLPKLYIHACALSAHNRARVSISHLWLDATSRRWDSLGLIVLHVNMARRSSETFHSTGSLEDLL